MTKPILTVIAGANGSGKTTLTKWAKAFFQEAAILDADAAAVDLQAQTESLVNPISAGRHVLKTARSCLSKGISFSIETTLSGHHPIDMLREATRLGYRTRLFYVGTENLAINIERVKARVLAGGHDVPVEDQLRRYSRSFANLRKVLDLVDEWALLDNSSADGPRVVAVKIGTAEMHLKGPVTLWAEFLREL